MQKHLRFLLLILFFSGLLPSSWAAGGAWSEDLPAALAQARKSGRPVLLDFTGSDWCGWCIRLHSEVFSQAAFQSFAEESLVLVTVDFPSKRSLSPELRAQNRQLAKKYSVTGYPTIVLIDADGRELGRSGYTYGGAKTFVRMVRGWMQQPAPVAPATK